MIAILVVVTVFVVDLFVFIEFCFVFINTVVVVDLFVTVFVVFVALSVVHIVGIDNVRVIELFLVVCVVDGPAFDF